MTAPQRDKDDVRNSTATCISFSTTKQADSLEYLSQTLFQALWQIASGAQPRLVVTEKKNDTQSGDTGANHQPMISNNCLPSLVAWHQVLRETVACRGRNAGLLSTTPPHNNQDEKKHHNVRHGKPWDIEVRLAASLYKRLTSRLSATQRRNKNTTQDNTVVTLLLTSDHGVVRPVSSAVALAQLIWTTAEPPAWRGTVSPQDAVVRVVTPARQAVLQAAGLAPCPHCAAWKQSLWWHVQTQHGTTHATAKEAAPCTERALVVYKPESSLVTQVQHAQPSQPSTKETFGTPNNDDTDKHRIPAKSATEHSRRAQAFTYAQNGQLKELQHAVAQGWVDAVHDVDDKGATLLHWAAGSGYVEVVQYLIQECRCPPRQGQQGKRRGFAGRTALHWACRKGHLAVVQYLVEVTQGAAVHDTTADGTAAVAWAAWQGHDDILHYLYDHTTVNLRALNSFGCNALLWAAQGTASSATVQWLVDTAQCPLLHVNDNRHGVLHKAAQRNRPEIVAWFQSYVMATFSTVDDVGRNADQILGLIAPDREGCTPSDLAGMEGHDKVAAQVQECERLLWHLVSPCAFPLSWKNAFDPTAVPGDYGPGCGVARLCELHQQIMTCSSSNEPKMDAPREKETAAPSTPVALATRAPKSLLFNFPVLLTIMVLLAASVTTEASILYDGHRQTLEDATAELPEDNPFKVVPEAFVIGPTVFPKPSDVQHLDPRNDSNNQQPLVPYLQPILGRHRPSKDAVLLFASEYRLENYVLFVESLRATGFTGDICMVIHPIHDWQGKPRLQEYLQSYALSSSDGEKDDTDDGEPHVVVYAPKPDCFNMERQHVDSSKGGTRTCLFHNLYGKQDTETGSIVPVLDPRSDRTVANIRYELYWLMALHYDPHSWILLVDARDTVFQINPFANLPRSSSQKNPSTEAVTDSGLLYFFGENRDATRIGLSKQNNKWIRTSYGDILGDVLANKPTICSGATLGEQIALETYLRAVVAEADETKVVLVGSDQGFHNRLYYSSKLANALTIRSITVFDQGTGIVNNMGAMRTRPLEEWGNGRVVVKKDSDYTVLNWDGTPSPVVHQFDRHKELSEYFFKEKTKDYLAAWQSRHV